MKESDHKKTDLISSIEISTVDYQLRQWEKTRFLEDLVEKEWSSLDKLHKEIEEELKFEKEKHLNWIEKKEKIVLSFSAASKLKLISYYIRIE